MAKRNPNPPKKRYYTSRGGIYRAGLLIPAEVVFTPLNPKEKPGKSWVPYHGGLPKRVMALPAIGAPPPPSTRRAMAKTSVPTAPEADTMAEAQDIENEEEAERLGAAGVDPEELPHRATGSAGQPEE